MKRHVVSILVVIGLSSVLFGQNLNISTAAGSVTNANGDNANIGLSPLFNPQAVAVDSAGVIYVADGDAHRVRKIDPSTNVTTVIVGQGRSAGSGDASIQGTASPINDPTGLALDPTGKILYIAERDNHKVKKLDLTTGALTTLVGFAGRSGFAGDGSPALYARIRNPYALATDKAGNVYIADRGNNKIRKVTIATGIITTVAGIGPINGDPSYFVSFFGDGGPATRAQLARPEGVAVDSAGNIFIADTNNNVIRRVDASSGVITTVAGLCIAGTPMPNTGNAPSNALPPSTLWPTCTSTTAQTNATPLASSTANNRLVNTFIDGTLASSATLNAPRGLAFDSLGNLFVADTGTHRIREITANGGLITSASVINTVAGSGTSSGFSGDGGLAIRAVLSSPRGVAIGPQGQIYITDQTQGAISTSSAAGKLRVVDPVNFTISTMNSNLFNGDGGNPANASFNDPRGIAVDNAGNVLISDTGNQRIRKLGTDGTLTTIAGLGSAGFGGDTAAAISSRLNNPNCIALDAAGTIYIADRSNNRVRKIDVTGIISTVAGGGTSDATDGILATNARLSGPRCVAVDNVGNLFIADTGNNSVRKVDINGIITTVAGIFVPNPLPTPGGAAFIGVAGTPIVVSQPTGVPCPSFPQNLCGVTTPSTEPAGDGGPANQAYLNGPQGISIDPSGKSLYIADTGNHALRVINLATGIITLVAGGYTDNSSDGLPGGLTPAAPAGSIGPGELTRLNNPISVAADASGNVYVADTSNYRVVKFDSAGFGYIVAGVSPFTCSATVTVNCSPASFAWGDAKNSSAVALTMPKAVAVDKAGNVYVAEGLGIIRLLKPAVSTTP